MRFSFIDIACGLMPRLVDRRLTLVGVAQPGFELRVIALKNGWPTKFDLKQRALVATREFRNIHSRKPCLRRTAMVPADGAIQSVDSVLG